MHDQSLIESFFEERSRRSIPLHPAAKMHASGEVIGLRAITSGVGEDEVVAEVDRIPRPRNEMVDVRRSRRDLTSQ